MRRVRVLASAALVCALAFGAPAQAQLSRLGIGGHNAADDAPILPRVLAGEFNARCSAPPEGVTEEQAESYDLLDTMSGAPLAARNDVSVVASTGVDTQLNTILRMLTRVAPPPPGADVRVSVQNTDDIDARQFGNGQILLTRGLVTTLRNQQGVPGDQIADQFAFILAHEYSHVLLCHYNRTTNVSHTRSMLRSASTIGLLAVTASNSSLSQTSAGVNVNTNTGAAQQDYVPVMAGLTVLRTLNSSVVNPAWSRAQERDADKLAVELMSGAKFHADNLGGMLPLLNQADENFGRSYVEITRGLPQQALSAGLASVQSQSTTGLRTQLLSMGLTAGVQGLQAWRSNQLRHFHDDPQRRIAALTQYVQQNPVSDTEAQAAASAYAGLGTPDRAAIGAALVTAANREMTAPELGLMAVRLLAANDVDGGCAKARDALTAGPSDVTALSASGQCALARHDIPGAGRHFDAVQRAPQATPDDFFEVSTLWAEADQRPRAETALNTGGRRFGADRFYVPRMNLLARYQDTAGVQTVAAECASAAHTDETRTQCSDAASRLTAPAQQQQQTNPTMPQLPSIPNPMTLLRR